MARIFLSCNSIDATDPLAQLFNAYTKGLYTLTLTAEPMYETMREVRRGFIDGTRKEQRKMNETARRYYGLSVLHWSLEVIHDQVVEAIKMLENFFSEHNGDLTQFAIQNRMRLIEEYGSDDDSDYLPGEPGEQWPVAYKDDPESLRHYTLYNDLQRFFGSGDTRGEYLGLSTFNDFYPYTAMVEQGSEFSLRKAFQGITGKELAISRMEADGNMVPMTLGDHIESEMNEDIRNGAIVEHFNEMLVNLEVMAESFHKPEFEASTNPELYRSLLNWLVAVRDVEVRAKGQEPPAPLQEAA